MSRKNPPTRPSKLTITSVPGSKPGTCNVKVQIEHAPRNAADGRGAVEETFYLDVQLFTEILVKTPRLAEAEAVVRAASGNHRDANLHVAGARNALEKALLVLFADGFVERAVYTGSVTIDELVGSFRKNLVANCRSRDKVEDPSPDAFYTLKAQHKKLQADYDAACTRLTERVAEATEAEQRATQATKNVKRLERHVRFYRRLFERLRAAVEDDLNEDD